MRQEPILITPAFYRYTTSIFILLICLIIPITSLFALDVSISGPDEVLVNESADFSVSVDCDAEITSVNWTFGDGSSSSGSTSASHRYKKVGDFTVTVSVTVSKTITNEEGEEKTYTDSGSDTHKITIKGKLKLKAEPDIIPVDTGSTTISAKVVDYRGSTVSSYNKTVNLTSSNTKTLKVKDISVSKGRGSSTAKAGNTPAKVTVKGNGEYLEGGSCEVKVVKVELIDTSREYVEVGKSLEVAAKVIPSDLTGGTWSWSTKPPSCGKGTFTASNPTTLSATGEGCIYPEANYTIEGVTIKSEESKRILAYLGIGENTATTPTSNPTIKEPADECSCLPHDPTLEWTAYFDLSTKKWRVRVTKLECTGIIKIDPWPVSGTPNPVPGGNVTENNYKDIIADLADYDTIGGGRGPIWHATKASRAHENYHWYTDWLKSCVGYYWGESESELEKLSIPEGDLCKAIEAEAILKKSVNKKFSSFLSSLTNKWNNEIAPKDLPGMGGGAYAAGQRVLNEIIDKINKFAKDSGWTNNKK